MQYPDLVTGPLADLIPVTPSDSADLDTPARAILITTDGDLKVTTHKGTDRTYPSGTFQTNVVIPLRVKRIWSTGTSATGIFAGV